MWKRSLILLAVVVLFAELAFAAANPKPPAPPTQDSGTGHYRRTDSDAGNQSTGDHVKVTFFACQNTDDGQSRVIVVSGSVRKVANGPDYAILWSNRKEVSCKQTMQGMFIVGFMVTALCPPENGMFTIETFMVNVSYKTDDKGNVIFPETVSVDGRPFAFSHVEDGKK